MSLRDNIGKHQTPGFLQRLNDWCGTTDTGDHHGRLLSDNTINIFIESFILFTNNKICRNRSRSYLTGSPPGVNLIEPFIKLGN